MSIYKARIPRAENYSNNIEIDKINKIDSAQFFDIVTPLTKELNNILINLCKQVVMESYSKGGKEAGAIFNTYDGLSTICEAKYFGKINFDEYEKYNEVYKVSKDYTCVVIHTHNYAGYFSLGDLITFLGDEKVHTIVVITSTMDIYILCKNKENNYTELKNYINSIVKYDYITPDIKLEMEKYNLSIRRITK